MLQINGKMAALRNGAQFYVVFRESENSGRQEENCVFSEYDIDTVRDGNVRDQSMKKCKGGNRRDTN